MKEIELILKKTIYNNYAFTENEKEKAKINLAIYKKLIKKYKIEIKLCTSDFKNLDIVDLAIVRNACYLHSTYNIIKNSTNLSTNEILLICDKGNLCFGGVRKSETEFVVYED